MTVKIKKTVIILLAHYLFYPFYFGFVSNALQQLLIFGSLLIYAFFNKEKVVALFSNIGKLRVYFSISLILYFLIFIASFFIPLLYRTMDFTYLSGQIRHLLYLCMYVILLILTKEAFDTENLKDKFLSLFTLTTRNYVMFTIFMLVFEPFKNIWIQLIHETPRRLELLEMPIYFARIGWAGYSGFTATFFCTLAVLFSIYLMLKKYNEEKSISIKELINLVFALVGNAFYGRSGLLVSLLLIGLGLLYFSVIYKKMKYILYVIIGLFVIFAALTILKELNATLASWYSWMMQPFVSLFESGRIETTSTDALWDMWFLPKLRTLLFGDGYYTSPINGRYYMGTDVGILRPLLFFGSGFLMLLYMIPLVLNLGMSKNNRLNKFLSIMFLLTLIIFEIKAEVVLIFIPIIMSIFIAECNSNKSYLKKGDLEREHLLYFEGNS